MRLTFTNCVDPCATVSVVCDGEATGFALCCCCNSGKKRKFPPESTDRTFFSWRRGETPATNLNLQMHTSLSLSLSGGKKMAERFFRRRWRIASLPPATKDAGSEDDEGADDDNDATIGIVADSGSVDDSMGSRTQRFSGSVKRTTAGATRRQISPFDRFLLLTRDIFAICS